jgi:MFS family permease
MYAFRKPFTVAAFENLSFFGIDYKILLIIAQVIGYTLSKFIGIKVISEMKQSKRMLYLISFIGIAELALLGFALMPKPYNIIFLFINGLPLGMIWGIVFSYLEGRKTTEILGVILCSSFIVSSGVVKSVGKYVLDVLQFSEYWMPFITGLFFIIPLIFFSFLLEKLPKPTLEDQQSRTIRKPLNKKERFQLYGDFAFPLTLIIIFYFFITGIRDFRDNFAREIWDALGYESSIGIYSYSEIPIAITVLFIMILIGTIKNNYKAFKYYHLVLLLGGLLIGLSTMLFQLQLMSPVIWMILSGFGMYTCYIPFQGLYFDRMIATFKIESNVGFLIYIADAFGYLGSVIILLYKNFGKGNISYVSFFTSMIYIIALMAISLAVLSYLFFKKKYQKPIQNPENLCATAYKQ